MGAGTWLMMAGAFAVCLWAALQSEWSSWRMLILLIAAGALLYALARRRQAA